MNRLLFGFIPIYGFLIACAIGAGVFLCSADEKRLGLPKDTAVDLTLLLVPLGVIGARLYFVAFEWGQFAKDPIRILYVWEGGLAIYGAVIGGAFGCFLMARKRHIPLLLLFDWVVPVLLLGQSVGRWGNFVNGEAYGYEVTAASLQFFPFAVSVDGVWHMATFFYESLWNFVGFLLFWLNRKKAKRRGDVFLWYLLWYGAARLAIEGLRTDSLMFCGLRVSQLLSFMMCVSALLVLALRVCAALRMRILPALAGIVLFALYAFTGVWVCTLAAAVCFLVSGILLYGKTPSAAKDPSADGRKN